MSKGGASKEESFQTGAPSSCLNLGGMVSTESVESSMPGWNLVAAHVELLAPQTWQPLGPWEHYANPSSAPRPQHLPLTFVLWGKPSQPEDLTERQTRISSCPQGFSLNLSVASFPLPIFMAEETRVKLGGAADMPGTRVRLKLMSWDLASEPGGRLGSPTRPVARLPPSVQPCV